MPFQPDQSSTLKDAKNDPLNDVLTHLQQALKTLESSVKTQSHTSRTMNRLNTDAGQSHGASEVIDQAVKDLIVQRMLC